MDTNRRTVLKAGAAAAAMGAPHVARAQTKPARQVRFVPHGDLRVLDPIWTTANMSAYHGAMIYDTLFGVDVNMRPQPQMVQTHTVSDNRLTHTFVLRDGLKWHDGTPVTAKDVKWSFDRAVTVGGFPTFQMAAGSLEKPEQFEVVDEHTFRVKFIRKDKLTMADLAVVVPHTGSADRVQECHIAVGHVIVELVEKMLGYD